MKKILVLAVTILLVAALGSAVPGLTSAPGNQLTAIAFRQVRCHLLLVALMRHRLQSLTYSREIQASLTIGLLNSATGNIEAGLAVTFTENGTSVLSNYLRVLLWIDKDNNDVLNPSDLVLKAMVPPRIGPLWVVRQALTRLLIQQRLAFTEALQPSMAQLGEPKTFR